MVGYGIRVRLWLDHHFPGHWNGRCGPVERPPKYPKLTTLDILFVVAFEGHCITGENTKCRTLKSALQMLLRT